MLKLMANFQVFQTIHHANFCISKGIKTKANFLITDIETESFIARDCTCSSYPVSFAVPFNFIRFLISALWIKIKEIMDSTMGKANT